MAILKESAGDFINDGIDFAVAVLLIREEKTDDIGKEGASAGGRGKLRRGRKLPSGRNEVQATFGEGNQRARAQGIAAAGNRVVFFRGNGMREWWCRNGHHPQRNGKERDNRRNGRTGE